MFIEATDTNGNKLLFVVGNIASVTGEASLSPATIRTVNGDVYDVQESFSTIKNRIKKLGGDA